jgi:hypothetical protein
MVQTLQYIAFLCHGIASLQDLTGMPCACRSAAVEHVASGLLSCFEPIIVVQLWAAALGGSRYDR